MATTEIPVQTAVDGKQIVDLFDYVERRLKTIESAMAQVGNVAEASAKRFKSEITQTLRDFNRAQSQLDKFERSVLAQQRKPVTETIDRRNFGRQVRDADQYNRGIKEAIGLNDQLAARINRVNDAIAARGRVHPAQRQMLQVLEQQVAAVRQLERSYDSLQAKARLSGGDFTRENAAVLAARGNLSQLIQSRGSAPAIAQAVRELQDAQAAFGNSIREFRRVQLQTIREAQQGLSSDKGADRALRSQQLKAELALTSDISAVEARRIASTTRINELMAAREGLSGKDRVAQNELIREEIERNRLIDARIVKLQAETAARTKADAELTRKGLASDVAPDRTLRLNQLRSELRGISDIAAIETRRDASNARLNMLIAERNLLNGKDRMVQNELIREEIQCNRLIDERLMKLRTQAVAEERAAARGTRTPGVFGATGLFGVVARTAAYGGAAQVLFGIQNTIRSGLQFTVEWEDALHKLAAIANATTPEMGQLKQAIIDIGKESRFSLVELTEMGAKLAQAGVSVSGMKDALRAVSTLAAASGSTPAEAVDLVTATLGSFQLQGKETARVADLMTTALNRTRLTVQQAALAIQYVGATAYEQNISLEQMMSTAAALSQAGIRSGSTIGTGFRQFLVDLQAPTEKLQAQFKSLGITMADVDVKTRGLPAVLETLHDKGFGSAQAYDSMEKRAAAFYLVAKNNLPLMNELQIAFADQGAAARAQERAMGSLAAQWQRFKNVIGESFAEQASGILLVFKNLLNEISGALEQTRKMAAEGKNPSGPVAARLASFEEWAHPAVADSLEYFANAFLSPWKYGSAKDHGIGTWLRNLGRDTNDATGQMTQLEAAMNRANQKTAEQRDTVSALDKEIQRLVTQKESLRGKEQLVTAETVNLMSRFSGLSANIQGATGDIEGLIGALERLKVKESQTLIDNINAEIGTVQSRRLDAQASRDAAVRQIRSTGALMNALGPRGRMALDQLGGANGRVAADALLRIAEQLQKTNAQWARLVTSAAANQQSIFSLQGQQGILRSEAGQLAAANTPFGQMVVHNITDINGQLDRLRSSEGPDRKRLTDWLNKWLPETEKGINKKLSSKTLTQEERNFLLAGLRDVATARSQMNDILRPSKAEERDADRQAQMLSFGSPVRGTPRITSGIGHRASPGGIGSTNHQGIDIAGNPGDPVYAAADGVVTEKTGWNGGYGLMIEIDHGLGTTTRYAHLSVIDVVAGQQVAKGEKIGRIGMTGNATGPHLHFERRLGKKIDRNPLSRQAPGSTADISDRAQRLQEKEENRAEREASARERFAMGTAERTLANALKQMRFATTDELFASGEAQVKSSLDAWADQLRKTTEADLDRTNATEAERKDRMREVEERIQQKREEVESQVFDYFLKSIDKAFETIELRTKKMLEPYELGVALAQGRVQGLSAQSLQGRVPDYVQQTAERQAGFAQENLDQARSVALDLEITQKYAAIQRLTQELSAKAGTASQAEVDEANKKLTELNVQVATLVAQKAQLDEALNVGSLLPQGFNANLQMAIENYREVHRLTASWSEMIAMNLTDAIGTAHQSLEQFLTDATSGTMTVQDAFRNMVLNVIKYLQQLLVKMIAVKLMQLALSAFGGSFKAPQTSGFSVGVSTTNTAPLTPTSTLLHGGRVKALTGRYIRHGVPNRDSVDARIANGEYVVRKSAVDSVGVDFMDKLNERGSDAVRSMGAKVVVPPPARQEMNVYVVAPEQQPQMGPNDVLVTIANDIYNGGPTKQLIRQVSQGG